MPIEGSYRRKKTDNLSKGESLLCGKAPLRHLREVIRSSSKGRKLVGTAGRDDFEPSVPTYRRSNAKGFACLQLTH